MSAPVLPRRFPWTALALGVALVSFAYTARVAAGLKRDLQTVNDRQLVAHDVAALAAEARDLSEGVRLAESRLGKAGPANLAPLLQAYLPEDGIKLTPRAGKPFGPAGWSIQESEVAFTALDWERLAKFLARAESEPLPWRIAQLSLEAVTPATGTGRVVLQRLENSGMEPNEEP